MVCIRELTLISLKQMLPVSEAYYTMTVWPEERKDFPKNENALSIIQIRYIFPTTSWFVLLSLCYGTVTYPLMDSSKFYINREPSTLENTGYSTDIRLTSLAYATTFLSILLLQYIFKFIPCSELSFRGPSLGPHHFVQWHINLRSLFNAKSILVEEH